MVPDHSGDPSWEPRDRDEEIVVLKKKFYRDLCAKMDLYGQTFDQLFD